MYKRKLDKPTFSLNTFPKLLILFNIFITFTINSFPASAAEGFSDINIALFDSPHMKGLTEPGTIKYQYKKIQETKETRKDSISVNVSDITASGRTSQSFDFFTGKNKRPYLKREKIMGNAIFMLYLEWDIHELQRQTEGSWRHFQRRIRWAMAENPKSQEVELTLSDGKKVKGIQYKIQPFAEDKNKDRYGKHVYKAYIFTLSDQVPGTIYEIRTIVPKEKSWKEGDKVLSVESMTFSSFTPIAKN